MGWKEGRSYLDLEWAQEEMSKKGVVEWEVSLPSWDWKHMSGTICR